MAVTPLHNGDKLWEAMSSALLEGRLPDAVTSVRANLFDKRNEINNNKPMFKVNIYTKDFGNQDEVLRVEDSIISNLNMPVTCLHMLIYKAEIYSYLNIFDGNKYGRNGKGIKPSMYVSKLIKQNKRV